MKDSKNTGDPTDTGEATDGQLFALMMRKGEEGKGAWAVFYMRYVGDLRRLVCRVRGLPNGGVDELVQDAMVQAYKSAHTFRADDSLDREVSRRRTLAWLGRMARNLYWSMLRRQKGVTVGSLPGQEEDGSRMSAKGRPLKAGELYREVQATEDRVSGIPAAVDEPSLRSRLLREALDALPERERDIIIETYEYYERGQKQQRLPRQVVDKICRTHGIRPDHLRQLRRRAHEKLEQYVNARMPAES